MLPSVAGIQAADGAAQAEREAGIDRLAARLVAPAKETMHVAQGRSVERPEARRMQRLREQQQRQIVRAQCNDRKADARQRKTRDQHLPQRERAKEMRHPEENRDLANDAERPQPADRTLGVAKANQVYRVERVVRTVRY